MRIVCERCQAAFSIDEKRIPEAGARAACPRCKHQVVVKRPESPPSLSPAPGDLDLFPPIPTREPTPGPGSAPFAQAQQELGPGVDATGLSAPVGLPPMPPMPDAVPPLELDFLPPPGAPMPPDPLAPGLGSSDRRTNRTGNALPPDPLERDGHTTGQFALPDEVPPPSPGRITGQQPLPEDPLQRAGSSSGQYAVADAQAAALASAGGRITGQHALPPDPLERDGHTTGQFAVPDAQAAAISSAAGRVTGQYPAPDPAKIARITGQHDAPEKTPGPSVSPEELFQGVTTSAGGKFGAGGETTGVSEALARLASGGETPDWRVKKQEGLVEGPFTASELTARFEAGLVQPTDLVSFREEPFQALSAYPLTEGFLKARGKRVKAFASSERGPLPWRQILAVLAVIVGVLLGASLFVIRPAFLFGKPLAPADAAALAIIDGWREKEGVPSASVKELMQLARGYHQADTREGFRRAAETYKRVLIKDPANLKAMSAFSEVRAILALEEGDEIGGRESVELLAYALRHGNELAYPHVARANMLSLTGTAGDLLVAQSEAQAAMAAAPNDPDVQLAWARAFLTTNPDLALESIAKVEKAEPDQHGVLLVKGEALLKQGRLAEARATFEKRREVVPDDATADMRLAELDASIGRFDRARARLGDAAKKMPRSAEIRLLHAMLAYQIDGDLPEARKELADLLAMPLDRRHKVRAAVHAAAVAHELGLTEDAEGLVKGGQAIEADAPAFAFRLALLRLGEGKPEEAKKLLAKAQDAMPDRAQRAILAGRIAAALGNVDEAQAEFSRAMVLSPLRIEPYLLAASLYAQVGAQSQALSLARKALQADPGWAKSHRSLTEFHEAGRTALDAALGGLETMAVAGDEAALTNGALAMARYHAGDLKGAKQAAERAIATGQGALAAHLYLAQMSLDANKPLDALESARTAVELDRGVALGHYLMGRALSKLGRYDEAHAKFRETLEQDPNFYPAVVRDAEAVAHGGQRAEAVTMLRKAYKSDPDDLYIRRELDALEQDEPPPPLDDDPPAEEASIHP